MVKKMLFIVLASVFGLILTTNSFSNDWYIYDFDYGGNGCPENTARAIMTPDHSQISIFFDEYIASSSESSTGRDRKSCSLGVSVHVPQGFSVALIELDYRGYVDVPPSAYASFNAEYFFAGENTGEHFSKVWSDDTKWIDEEFFLTDQFPAAAKVWSACGADTIIRANTSLKAYQSKTTDEHAYAQLDTIDVEANMVYQLQWKTCTQ
ncbi:MAG: DUF4360 domain-containing protein [Desulfobacteraceae bacterium]|nr:DUF4360 domain-containing protein [Desulfobacteraceae bacterium]